MAAHPPELTFYNEGIHPFQGTSRGSTRIRNIDQYEDRSSMGNAKLFIAKIHSGEDEDESHEDEKERNYDRGTRLLLVEELQGMLASDTEAFRQRPV